MQCLPCERTAADHSTMQSTILVTGGAGFIGSNFILQRMKQSTEHIVNLDKLTYAGNLRNLESVSSDRRYEFVHGDIADRELVRRLLERCQPCAIVHFAAESHVDRSIRGPDDFIRTNVDGTFALLEETRAYWSSMSEDRDRFRFLHVSTDEVYGSLGPNDPPFPKPLPTRPTVHTPHRRRRPIIWCVRTTTPMDCPRSQRIARITMDGFSFLRN